ncbi:hypothetical protein KC19_VG292400 [Ceratodon purpureus]|uniref:Uncharacterized protein n=1 Tax=Ceratodon purpureus TaxID=3225 RepID=A0A8T0HVR4_CERPU|nr:hypothetical protein KC19_VG292400 [Ceratodon purpureus]
MMGQLIQSLYPILLSWTLTFSRLCVKELPALSYGPLHVASFAIDFGREFR